MRKILWLAAAAAALGLAARSAQACSAHGGKGASCPMKVKGSKVQVEKTATGVVIRIDGDNDAAVREIQAHADKMAAAKEHACGGACAEHGEKHGKKHSEMHGDKKADKGAEKADKNLIKASDKAVKQASCPMKGCYAGPMTSDGRCPKCGMKLE